MSKLHINDPDNPLSRRAVLKWGTRALPGMGSLPLLAGCNKSQRTQPPDAPTIVLITLDTTRADHLSCYGYRRLTSPHLDRLAERSLVYDRMIANGTWTLPSHASLFTGKFTSSHGARKDANGSVSLYDGFDQPSGWMTRLRTNTISRDETTLAMLLRTAGYATCGIVGGVFMKRVFGLDKGFDHYDDSEISWNGKSAEKVTDQALTWLQKNTDRPHLLFLNYFDPHGPYVPPEEFATRFERRGTRYEGGPAQTIEAYGGSLTARIALYDAEILYMDYHLGRLLDGLAELGLYDKSWIIITADHGELHGELHGEDWGKFGHSNWPYQEVVHIPLIIKEPGGQGPKGRTDQWIQLPDIFAMILDRVGINIPDETQGNVPPNLKHPILIESKVMPGFEEHGHWLSIIDRDGMKYIWNSRSNHMLFDLKRDPAENENLYNKQTRRAEEMRKEMGRYMAGLPQPGAQLPMRQVDRDTIRSLKSLGYVK